MTTRQMSAGEQRAIVVVVGPASNTRTRTVTKLMAETHSVVLCAGPPACALLRGERCALVDVADAMVLIPRSHPSRPEEAGLSLCAKAARCAVVIDGSTTAPWPAEAIQVDAEDIDGVARGLAAAGSI